MESLSIIIPTLNEIENIRQLLQYLKSLDSNCELIIADGGSTDNTIKEAKRLARIANATKGRGSQMNAGAKIASGDILWFLHADCRPHPDSVRMIQQTMENPQIVGGGFVYSLNHPAFRFRIIESFSNNKNRLFKLLYGDMGIFVRKSVFEQMDGYREIPLMEDMDFSRRLKKIGKIVILPFQIQTSARRWIEEGWIHSSIRSWLLQSLWALGASPEFLSRFYLFK